MHHNIHERERVMHSHTHILKNHPDCHTELETPSRILATAPALSNTHLMNDEQEHWPPTSNEFEQDQRPPTNQKRFRRKKSRRQRLCP
jgi:hypothetical protein